jgi:hypothetical protein
VLTPTEGLGGAALVGGVLQMVSEPTLVVARTGQCAGIGRMACVGLRWDTQHGIWVSTGRSGEATFKDRCRGTPTTFHEAVRGNEFSPLKTPSKYLYDPGSLSIQAIVFACRASQSIEGCMHDGLHANNSLIG